MKTFFDYIKNFAFKNFFAVVISSELLYILVQHPELKDVLIVLVTLIIKHFFDSNTGSVAKDVTISKALDQAQQLPAVGSNPVVSNAETVNVQK